MNKTDPETIKVLTDLTAAIEHLTRAVQDLGWGKREVTSSTIAAKRSVESAKVKLHRLNEQIKKESNG